MWDDGSSTCVDCREYDPNCWICNSQECTLCESTFDEMFWLEDLCCFNDDCGTCLERDRWVCDTCPGDSYVIEGGYNCGWCEENQVYDPNTQYC